MVTIYQNHLESPRKTITNLRHNSAEMQTKYLPNVKLVCYHYTHLFSAARLIRRKTEEVFSPCSQQVIERHNEQERKGQVGVFSPCSQQVHDAVRNMKEKDKGRTESRVWCSTIIPTNTHTHNL
jgi:hypothetical protein